MERDAGGRALGTGRDGNGCAAAARLRSQSRRLARLAGAGVNGGDREALLEAAAWLEILAKGFVEQGERAALRPGE